MACGCRKKKNGVVSADAPSPTIVHRTVGTSEAPSLTQSTSGTTTYNPLRYYVVPKAQEQAGQGEAFNTLAEAQQRLRQLGSAWTIVSRRG